MHMRLSFLSIDPYGRIYNKYSVFCSINIDKNNTENEDYLQALTPLLKIHFLSRM